MLPMDAVCPRFEEEKGVHTSATKWPVNVTGFIVKMLTSTLEEAHDKEQTHKNKSRGDVDDNDNIRDEMMMMLFFLPFFHDEIPFNSLIYANTLILCCCHFGFMWELNELTCFEGSYWRDFLNWN